MKLNYEALLDTQEFWLESEGLSQQQKDGFIVLSNLLMERTKEKQGELDDVELYYPEDFQDFEIFTDFAFALSAYVVAIEGPGVKICGWCLNREVDVE